MIPRNLDLRTGFLRQRVRQSRPRRRGPARSPNYRRWIAQQGCIVCDGASQAAHVGNNGMRSKASDFSCLPICPWHHLPEFPGSYHQLGREGFEEKYGLDLDTLMQEYRRRWEALRCRC